jgi:ribosomal protein S18 acetylase RimI-like enzyme
LGGVGLIKYRTGKRVAQSKLAALYEAVRWLHFKMPRRLQEAYQKSDFVVTAWDGEKLVGAGRAITDGIFNAYIADVAVHPTCRGRGIGRKIVLKLLSSCESLYNVTAVAEDPAAENFYRKCGLRDERKAFRKMTPIPG